MAKRTNTAVWLEKHERWQINVQKDGIRKTFTSSIPGRNGQREANRKAWFTNMPKNIPVLLVAGEADPVGDFSEGVEKVHNGLIRAGVRSEMKIYDNARHEILNDISYDAVVRDILAFCR